MPFSFWCYNCQQLLCRACGTQSDHIGHSIKSNNDARDHLISEVCIVCYLNCILIYNPFLYYRFKLKL